MTRPTTWDVITVGGGLAGAALGTVLARAGVRVLILEREERFRDRVRGEGLLPWGVGEARDLGLEQPLLSCGRPLGRWDSHAWSRRPPRDLVATTPRQTPCVTFYHPQMQETMLETAARAGATVWRGVAVRDLDPGTPVKVRIERNTREECLTARLVAGADGRTSVVRRWLGTTPWRGETRLKTAGVLLDGVTAPDDSVHVFRNATQGHGVLMFPLGTGRVRTYYIHRVREEDDGALSGHRQLPALLEACHTLGVPEEWLAHAVPAGPLAEFDGADTWVRHPYRDGVALIGDAASSNDPAWGNGLSLTLRDVRTLSESLLGNPDWNEAGHRYAEAHDRYFGSINRITGWLTDLMYEIGAEADARRARAFPRMEEDRTRSPDYIALGPEAPHDEQARRRMFGED